MKVSKVLLWLKWIWGSANHLILKKGNWKQTPESSEEISLLQNRKQVKTENKEWHTASRSFRALKQEKKIQKARIFPISKLSISKKWWWLFLTFWTKLRKQWELKKEPKTIQKLQKTKTVTFSVYYKEPLSLVFRNSALKLKSRSTHYTQQKLNNRWKQWANCQHQVQL